MYQGSYVTVKVHKRVQVGQANQRTGGRSSPVGSGSQRTQKTRPTMSPDRSARPLRSTSATAPPSLVSYAQMCRSAMLQPAHDRGDGDHSEHDRPGGGAGVLLGKGPWPVCSRWLARVTGCGGGWQCSVFVCAEQAAALQGEEQGEGGTDEEDGGAKHGDEGDQGGLLRARIGQGYHGAGQQYRVAGHAPAPHDGSDPESGDDPDTPQPSRGEQGDDHQAADTGEHHQR